MTGLEGVKSNEITGEIRTGAQERKTTEETTIAEEEDPAHLAPPSLDHRHLEAGQAPLQALTEKFVCNLLAPV